MRLLRRLTRRWRQTRLLVALVRRAESCRTEAFDLLYPPTPWYREHAGEIGRVVDDAASRLTQTFGLALPKGAFCLILEPDSADAIEGMRGVAWERHSAIVLPEGHLSELAGVAAHEVAHLLARCLGASRPLFKGEGFACYAAWRVRLDVCPFGLHLHEHTAWLLAKGVHPALRDLWRRDDCSPETYELAWSFASFLAGRYGLERYFAFYASRERTLAGRIEVTFGRSLEGMERDWHQHVRQVAPVLETRVLEARRQHAAMRSRLDWLHGPGTQKV